MLTRYGRNNIGFLWLFIEPMVFTLIVVGIRSASGNVYGGHIPAVAFAVTGWPSMMLWRNMAGRLIGAVKSNRSLLHHQQVTILDIYLTRITLEQLATTTSFVAVGLILYAFGWLSPPEDALEVAAGWFLLGWFGAGLALIIGSLSDPYPIVGHFWRPASYILMPLSGIAFVADALPEKIRELALWLPMLNALEFLRDGWFGSQFHAHYNVGYVIACNACMTFIGLSLARRVALGLDEE